VKLIKTVTLEFYEKEDGSTCIVTKTSDQGINPIESLAMIHAIANGILTCISGAPIESTTIEARMEVKDGRQQRGN
jgi:hypothetical protein